MVENRVVSLIVVGVITTTVFASGPFVPIDVTSQPGSCEVGTLTGEGSPEIQPLSVPESATLRQSGFGAEVWQLDVPDVEVQVTDVQGCVELNYEVRVDALGTIVSSTTVLSDESTGQFSIPKATLQPDSVSEDQYDGELRLTYHGEENGTAVERTVVNQTITVETQK